MSPKKINKFLGSLAGRILLLFGKKPKPTESDFKKNDFSASTQKIGVSFTDKIRNVFRFKWIKRG